MINDTFRERLPEYIVSYNTSKLPVTFCDFLVIGSGIAGLSAARECSKYGLVKVVTKGSLEYTNTFYAQGGIACAVNGKEDIEGHIKDTFLAGRETGDIDVIKHIISEASNCIEELISAGIEFDRDKEGNYDLTSEGGHSRARIFHAFGDSTGKAIEKFLVKVCRSNEKIEFEENNFVIDIINKEGEVFGVIAFNKDKGKHIIIARKIIISSGGLGQVYRETTNPLIATGDGVGFAYRAGAEIMGMEFVQFHPTTLYVAGAPRMLITETVRGEGGYLLDKNKERFMPEYSPAAEMAPRDIVSRSILDVMKNTNWSCVYLDLRHLDSEFVKKRFPGINAFCLDFGIDITKDLIPVRPSAHYAIGGIKTNLKAETSLRNVYACGEVAYTGFHGANRLGSNSLLEGLVMGKTAGRNAGESAKTADRIEVPVIENYRHQVAQSIDIWDVTNALKSLMWHNAGIEREEAMLEEGLKSIIFWSKYILKEQFNYPSGWELQNMIINSYLIINASLWRKESRGVHYRSDYPETKEEYNNKFLIQQRD